MKLSSLIDFDWKRKNLHVPKGFVKMDVEEEIWLEYDKDKRELTIICKNRGRDKKEKQYKFNDKRQLSDFIKDLQEYEEDMWVK